MKGVKKRECTFAEGTKKKMKFHHVLSDSEVGFVPNIFNLFSNIKINEGLDL